MILKVRVINRKVLLEPLDLWERVWGCGKGKGTVEEAELELDEEEEIFWMKRTLKK